MIRWNRERSTNGRAFVESSSGILFSVRELGFAETSAARAVDRRWRRIVIGVGFERAIADPVAGLTASEAVAGLHPVVVTLSETSNLRLILNDVVMGLKLMVIGF